MDEDANAPPMLKAMRASESIAILIGPEGGWTGEERAEFVTAGWLPVSLGPTILRSETAAIAALAVVNAGWQSQQ